MPPLSQPLRFLLVALASWINEQQRDVIDYLREENRVLREQLEGRRVRFNTLINACSSTIGPRDALINRAVGFIFSSSAPRPGRA